MSSDEDMMVKIAVKNVYERNLTVALEMECSSSILALKEALQERMDAEPKHQRLIFGGKICENVQTLAQVLKRMEPNEVYTFHLLVSNPDKPAPMRSPPTSAAAPVASSPAAVPAAPMPVAPPTMVAPTASTATSPFTFPLPHMPPGAVPHVGAAPSMPLPSMFPFPQASTETPSPSPCFPAMPGLQTLQLQHYLAQQETLLLMQIQFLRHLQECQQIYGAHQPSTSTSPLTNISSFTTRTFTVYRDDVPAAEAPMPRRRFAAIRAVLVLLDLKLAVKMAVMMYIIGQDLPLPRLYLLIGISSVIYLYLTGILNKIYDMIQGNHPEAPTPIPNAANDNNDFEVPPMENLAPTTPFLTIPAEGGWWKDLQIFLMGLLVSLLPSWRPLATPTPNDPPVPVVEPVGQE
ncbi:hypothetical protein SPRG_08586 [Saprolegnia parasitica CBS 223.65]|uniref:Ubiquitin-like domain-containing protein n=1 Tax=Saprolegnia parasitica (strain CBS 223.65) TaxID=695850 RepID=A0A067CHA3_SAPPC|nr:hypothetical protein SPRG_08586 [Saprolegnia parasitica CBS 223.65]KDO25931.1 hypothetical protein SPRG_08586 [Saprolegnia parasitica CBS 223.65]|eukprot:XP_012203220.1 hypothetical protein SPRG_08586 [Saprolegnia parasitica CBS 223.65]